MSRELYLLLILLALLVVLFLFFLLIRRRGRKGKKAPTSLQVLLTPSQREDEKVLRELGGMLRLLAEDYQGYYPGLEIQSHPKYSHIVGKRRIFLCMRDPETGELFSKNTLIQVAVHELSHALCPESEKQEHGPAFIEVNNRLNELGVRRKLFDPSEPIPERYYEVCTRYDQSSQKEGKGGKENHDSKSTYCAPGQVCQY